MANNKQRDAARRQLQQQLAERQQREAARKRFTLIASIVGTLVLIVAVVVVIALASGGGKKHKTATGADTVSTSPASSTAPATPGSCTFTAGGTAARKVTAPAATVPTKGTVTVSLTTNRGPITITMDRAKAPCTVESFVSLVKQKYFDDTHCHRLTTSGIYVLQCGDPTAAGTGGPGYTIPDEYTGAEKYTAGVLAMANTGQPHSGGSQFFIVYKDTQLPAQYTVFGTVTKGLDVVQPVAAGGTDNANGSGDGHPKLAVTITKATATG